MQGKLIAVAYSLRKYWNQFSVGGVCKQEYWRDASVLLKYLRKIKAFKFDNFYNLHYSFLWPEYVIDFFYVKMDPHVRLCHPSCVYFTA